MDQKPIVSVIISCYSRQEMIDKTLPAWLKQEDIRYEVILGVGPDIVVPGGEDQPNLRVIRWTKEDVCDNSGVFSLIRGQNNLLKQARGRFVLTTYSDMLINSDTQIRDMVNLWSANKNMVKRVVSARHYGGGYRHSGIFCHCLLVERDELNAIGGWYNGYVGTYAHEDSELMATLIERGNRIVFYSQSPEEGVHHIDHAHPHPDTYKDKFEASKAIYASRHKYTITQLVMMSWVMGGNNGGWSIGEDGEKQNLNNAQLAAAQAEMARKLFKGV